MTPGPNIHLGPRAQKNFLVLAALLITTGLITAELITAGLITWAVRHTLEKTGWCDIHWRKLGGVTYIGENWKV